MCSHVFLCVPEIDKNETENDTSDQSVGGGEMKEISEFTTEELQADRLKKKEKQETATESELKTSKLATKRQKKR